MATTLAKEHFSGRPHDDLTRNGDLSFAEHVRKRFKERMERSLDFTESMLTRTHSFDEDESFQLHLPDFAADERELKERWRLRVKFEILVERSNGMITEDAIAFLRSRYDGIRHQHKALDDEELTRIYADSLAAIYDSQCAYVSDSELALFRTGFIANRTIGLGLSRRNGDFRIARVSPKFLVFADPESLIGWNVIAIRRTDGTTYHLTEMSRPRMMWLIHSPVGQLKTDQHLILELYNPLTHQRTAREWLRLAEW